MLNVLIQHEVDKVILSDEWMHGGQQVVNFASDNLETKWFEFWGPFHEDPNMFSGLELIFKIRI